MLRKFLILSFILVISCLSINVLKYFQIKEFSSKYIAHALGEYNGIKYSNTKDAFEHSYKTGFRFFEVDLTITPDNEIVAFHSNGSVKMQQELCNNLNLPFIDSSNMPNYQKFISLDFSDQITKEQLVQVDIREIINWLKKYQDIKILVHIQENNIPRKINALKKIAKLADYDAKILDRIIVGTEVNPAKEIIEIKKLGYFKNVEFDIKKRKARIIGFSDMDTIINFLKENNINIVSFSIKAIYESPDELKKLKENNICVLAFTTNNKRISKELINQGVDYVGTDNIRPFDINEIELLERISENIQRLFNFKTYYQKIFTSKYRLIKISDT